MYIQNTHTGQRYRAFPAVRVQPLTDCLRGGFRRYVYNTTHKTTCPLALCTFSPDALVRYILWKHPRLNRQTFLRDDIIVPYRSFVEMSSASNIFAVAKWQGWKQNLQNLCFGKIGSTWVYRDGRCQAKGEDTSAPTPGNRELFSGLCGYYVWSYGEWIFFQTFLSNWENRCLCK